MFYTKHKNILLFQTTSILKNSFKKINRVLCPLFVCI